MTRNGPSRRSLLVGLGAAAILSPSIVRAQSFLHHVCYAEDLGMVGDYITPGVGSYAGSFNAAFTDNAPAWNLIMSTVRAGDTVILPPGFCGFKSAPLPIPAFVRVVGSGGETSLVKSYAGSGEQIFIVVSSYTIVENVLLWQADGYTDGVAIGRVGSSPSDTPYKITLRNVQSTYFNTGMWTGGCKISGEFGSPNYGTRVHLIDDCTFKASFYGIQLTACNAAKVTNFSSPNATWGMWFVGKANNPCTDALVTMTEGSFLAYRLRTSDIQMGGGGAIILDNDCSGVTMIAAFASPAPIVGGSGAGNNHVYANGNWYNG